MKRRERRINPRNFTSDAYYIWSPPADQCPTHPPAVVDRSVNTAPISILGRLFSVVCNIPLASSFRSAVPVMLRPGLLCTCLLAEQMKLKCVCFKVKALFSSA